MTINRAANKVPPTGTRWLRLSREPNPKGQPADSQQRCSDKNSFSSWLRLCAQDDKPRKAVRHLRTSPRNKRGRKNLNDGQTYRCTCEPRPQTSHPFALSPFLPFTLSLFPNRRTTQGRGNVSYGPAPAWKKATCRPQEDLHTYRRTHIQTYRRFPQRTSILSDLHTFTPPYRAKRKIGTEERGGVLDP